MSLFQKASKKKKLAKIMVSGPPGSGKTFFALGWPEPKVIDLEAGTDFYSDTFNFDVLNTKSYKDVMEAIAELEKNPGGTVVIDPITVIYKGLQDARLKYRQALMKKKGASVLEVENTGLTQQDWGNIKLKYNTMMTRLINLPMNVIVIAHESDLYDETPSGQPKKIGVKPDADKKTPYAFDIVFRLYVEKGVRKARIEKDRTNTYQVGQVIEGPSYAEFAAIIERFSEGEPATQQVEDAVVAADAQMFDENASQAIDQQVAEQEKGSAKTVTVTEDVQPAGQTDTNAIDPDALHATEKRLAALAEKAGNYGKLIMLARRVLGPHIASKESLLKLSGGGIAALEDAIGEKG